MESKTVYSKYAEHNKVNSRCAVLERENDSMTNWQMIYPGPQLRHEPTLKEKSLNIGREMFTPREKLLNLFFNCFPIGENRISEPFLNSRTETSKGKEVG